ncbi:large ribosomal subunit protein mL40 [Stomoxys calcitrans]|uniref:Large ribosomal subunit protein mL40 n=1 Tax=Stomoxys calcitrans TaxID=35570 RepID=A0A1I8PID9_STOCA|nr:large ribosomal subunit protein mL40 [Stomoxys calcitrans]
MSLLNALSRLSLQTTTGIKQPLALAWLHTSPVLCAEPLKKKKKLDPQIIKQREDRRKKKLEKQIRRLEKNSRQLKPVEELEVPLTLIDEQQQRSRKLSALSEAELERRVQLNKQWSRYKHEQKINDFQIIDRLMRCQSKALDELRLESEELYQEAIQPDMTVLPVKMKGPVATPPIKDYVSPDGEYILEAKKWDIV